MSTKPKEAPVEAKAVQEQVKVATAYPESGFVDFRKSNNMVITVGKIKIVGILSKTDQKACWMVTTAPEDGSKGKVLGFFGPRKDGKGVYCASTIKQICSDPADKAQETVTV